MCGEERLLCGKEFSLRVCGDEITVQGRIQDFRGGGVPTLYINRYMSWEARGGGFQSIRKLGGGGEGLQGWRHFICHGRGGSGRPCPQSRG